LTDIVNTVSNAVVAICFVIGTVYTVKSYNRQYARKGKHRK